MTCQSNSSKGRGHDRLWNFTFAKWVPKMDFFHRQWCILRQITAVVQQDSIRLRLHKRLSTAQEPRDSLTREILSSAACTTAREIAF